MDITCVTFDCADHRLVAEFRAGALGWEATDFEHSSIVARPGVRAMYLEFVTVPEPKTIKNRLHLGHETAIGLDAEMARLEALGAVFAWEEDFEGDEHYRNVVMRDPEGNEFCLGWRDTTAAP